MEIPLQASDHKEWRLRQKTKDSLSPSLTGKPRHPDVYPPVLRSAFLPHLRVSLLVTSTTLQTYPLPIRRTQRLSRLWLLETLSLHPQGPRLGCLALTAPSFRADIPLGKGWGDTGQMVWLSLTGAQGHSFVLPSQSVLFAAHTWPVAPAGVRGKKVGVGREEVTSRSWQHRVFLFTLEG